MKEAQTYYLKRVSTPEPHSPTVHKRAGAHPLRTYASSPNMALPSVPRQNVDLSRANPASHEQLHQHVRWRGDSRQQPHSVFAQPPAMRSLEPALPSMPEASATSQAPAPAGAQEHDAASGDMHATAGHHKPHNRQGIAKACIKHAGIGGMSPPQAREQAKAPAARSSSPTSTAYLQASSTQGEANPGSSQQAPAVEPAPEFVSAFSGASLLQAEDELRSQSDSGEEHATCDLWPQTCSWTIPCHVYKYRTVTFNFRDPSLPGVLQPAINVSLHYPVLNVQECLTVS